MKRLLLFLTFLCVQGVHTSESKKQSKSKQTITEEQAGNWGDIVGCGVSAPFLGLLSLLYWDSFYWNCKYYGKVQIGGPFYSATLTSLLTFFYSYKFAKTTSYKIKKSKGQIKVCSSKKKKTYFGLSSLFLWMLGNYAGNRSYGYHKNGNFWREESPFVMVGCDILSLWAHMGSLYCGARYAFDHEEKKKENLI